MRICIAFMLMIFAVCFQSCNEKPADHTSNAVVELPKDSTARVERVADDVYAIIHDNATDDWPHSNVGVIVGDKDVMVIDANYLPSRSRADISLIRKITSKPVKYLVYTHWHFDHNAGAIAYVDSFPEIKTVCEKENQKYVELNGHYWSKMNTAPGSRKRKSLQLLEDELLKGADTSGRKFGDDEIKKRQLIIAQRKNELAELEGLRVVKPNTVFEKEMEIQLGNKKVLLKDWGKANSPHDVTIYLPGEQVLFTGDIVVQSPLPYTIYSWPVRWIAVLEQMEAMKVNKLVPGHGPVQNDFAYVKQLRSFFEDAIKKVEGMVRAGKELKEIQAEIDLSSHLRSPWNRDEEAINDFKATVTILVDRIFYEIKGHNA